ncbi:uncharacterized protein EV154DRAFT_483994 [Mucor mucedo]|uniref:uncharacterized protein n=1 Tax=Mucor mucedo TaxID=29922 RepID=UPI00221EB18F|nr:uncharacterized protein EV154DRAFT_483994 [Mucor mucedo]KAI7888524.1 hypothetical protein EV154DRAFT_483994 [Mucor mucedo]
MATAFVVVDRDLAMLKIGLISNTYQKNVDHIVEVKRLPHVEKLRIQDGLPTSLKSTRMLSKGHNYAMIKVKVILFYGVRCVLFLIMKIIEGVHTRPEIYRMVPDKDGFLYIYTKEKVDIEEFLLSLFKKVAYCTGSRELLNGSYKLKFQELYVHRQQLNLCQYINGNLPRLVKFLY